MENVKSIYMPVGQVVKINYRGEKIRKFIKEHKLSLAIISISTALLVSYGILITKFVQLIKILG